MGREWSEGVDGTGDHGEPITGFRINSALDLSQGHHKNLATQHYQSIDPGEVGASDGLGAN